MNTLTHRPASEVPVKEAFKLLGVFLLVLGVLRYFPSASFLFALGALGITQGKRVDYVFFLILLLSGLNVSNDVFFPKTYNYIAGNRFTMLTLFLLLLSRRAGSQASRFFRPFHWLIAYIVYMMLASLYGWMPLISELKAMLFLLFILTYMQGTRLIADRQIDIRRLRAAVLAIATFYIGGSLAVMPFPAIGQSMLRQAYVDTTKGMFNGVTNHSQMLGPVVAMLNGVLLADMLFNLKRRSWLHLMLLAAIPVIVYKTSSRTGLLSYVVSLAAPVFFFGLAKGIAAARRTRVIFVSLLLAAVVLGVIMATPQLRTGIEVFLRKAGTAEKIKDDQTMMESLTASRAGSWEEGMRSFRESPILGNGFQVSRNMKGMPIADYTQLLSAPIEKGVIWTMVLEEGGLIGGFIFAGFCLSVYMTYKRLRCYCILSAFTVMLALNSGEAVFFSTTAGGGIAWVLCFYALLMDLARIQGQSMQRGLQAIMAENDRVAEVGA